AGVSPSEDARFALICIMLISKFCAGRFARPLRFVDVLLFSFQGSSYLPLNVTATFQYYQLLFKKSTTFFFFISPHLLL
ncbi:MAG: hypothetical protein N2C11_04420, partial [Planococcus sp. (in: firmicutes)]